MGLGAIVDLTFNFTINLDNFFVHQYVPLFELFQSQFKRLFPKCIFICNICTYNVIGVETKQCVHFEMLPWNKKNKKIKK